VECGWRGGGTPEGGVDVIVCEVAGEVGEVVVRSDCGEEWGVPLSAEWSGWSEKDRLTRSVECGPCVTLELRAKKSF